MNILFLTSDYVSPYKGGVEKVTFLLHNEFIKKGINSYIISLSNCADDTEIVNNHFVFPQNNREDFLCDFVKTHNINIIINQSHHIFILDICKHIKNHIDFKLISVYHTAPGATVSNIFDDLGFILFSEFSVGKIRNIISWFVRYPYRYYTRKQYLKHKLSNYYNCSDAFVLLSSRFIDDVQKLIGSFDTLKIISIPNPINVVNSSVCIKKKQILFVGRMIFSAKRPDRIIKIWEKISSRFPEWELLMLGDGPDKGKLEDYCKRKDIKNIIFTGNVNPDSYYDAASILCMTSSYEGFGMVLIEALQHKCIPIAYNSFGALSDIIIDNVNGYSIPPFNEKIFVEKLQYLMSNADERERLAANNAVTLDKFDINKVSQQWLDLFDNLLK